MKSLLFIVLLSALNICAQTNELNLNLDSLIDLKVSERFELLDSSLTIRINESLYKQEFKNSEYDSLMKDVQLELSTSSLRRKLSNSFSDRAKTLNSFSSLAKQVNDSVILLHTELINLREYQDSVRAIYIKTINSDINQKGEDIASIQTIIKAKQLYWLIAFLILMLSVAIVYFILEKERKRDKDLLITKHKEIFEKQIEDGQKLTEWLTKQSAVELTQKENTNGEIDHSFAKRVADAIVKIYANLDRMDESIKGHKQLKRSAQKLEKSMQSNGYEMLDLLNQPYHEGMNLVANFIEDENLKENERIITRVIKPQLNYRGVLIQAAQIEVSQGL